jgi:hypothetical protein
MNATAGWQSRFAGQIGVVSGDADNHSARGAFRSIVPIEKRRFAGKVEAAGIEPAQGSSRRWLVVGGTRRRVWTRRRPIYAASASFTSHARPARTLISGLGVLDSARFPLVCSVELVETSDVLQTRTIARLDAPEHGDRLSDVFS